MSAVRLVCWKCAERYAHVVDPKCPLCFGKGVLAAPVPEGVEPLIAGRAASISTPWGRGSNVDAAISSLRRNGRLVPVGDDAVGLAEVSEEPRVKMQAGKAAKKLLRGEKPPALKPPKPKPVPVPTPEQIEARRLAEERAAAKWRDEAIERKLERERQRRREEAEAAAIERLMERHADEFATELECEQVMAAARDMPDYSRPWFS